MRLDRISLRGLTTFGQTVDIDTAALPAGLIAVTGENGSGKTTLLESMAAPLLDRKFPSRGDGALVDYATSRDAFIENTYTLDGRGTFRARVNLDGLKRTTDALLSQIHADGQVTRLSDGKATTFDAKIAEIFPSKSLLLSTVFASQNRRGSFLTASKSQRKDLFGELLGLQHFEQKAAAAKAVANKLTTLIAGKRALLERLAIETSDAVQADLDARAQTLTVDLGNVEEQLAAATAEIDAFTGNLRTAQAFLEAKRAAARSLDAATEKHAAATLEQDKLLGRRADADAVHTRETRAAQTRHQLAVDRIQAELNALPTEEVCRQRCALTIAAIDARLAVDVAVLDGRIEKNQGLINRAGEVREAATAVATADAQIDEIAAALETELASIRRDEATLRDLRIAHAATAHVESDLQRARQSAALLTTVPCGGAAPYDGCSLLQSAVDARASIPQLEAQLGDRADQAEDITAREADLADATNHVTVTRTDLANLKKTADALRPVANELAFLEAAEQRIADYREEIERLTRAAAITRKSEEADLDVALADRDRRHDVLSKERQLVDATLTNETDGSELVHATTLQTIDAELLTVSRTLAALAAEINAGDQIRDNLTAAAEAVEDAETNLQVAQERRSDLDTDRARLLERLEAHHRELGTLKTKLIEHAALAEQVRAIETDRIEWDLLAGAFGRDGLPTIEMDAAGPAVSDLCNDLLEAGLGSRRFTVELVTQEPKADGKGLKETFELKVTDSDRGNEARDVTDLSGGEQVLLDESLKAAIAVFLNQRNERPLRTCWRDETTGALDPENALRYVAMLRRLQTLAGFHQIFMISHNPIVAAMADAQLQVAHGAVTVAYPPFAQEAA